MVDRKDRMPGLGMIGRDSELRWLDARLRPGRSRRTPVVVVVRGPIGIGKTSLVDAALARCADSVICRATAVRGGEAGPELFAALREAGVRQPELDPGAFEDWYTDFTVWARNRTGVVLVVDDVQWCEEPTLRWLGLLARRAAGLPLRIVLVRTRKAADARVPDLECWYGTETLDLGGLPEQAVSQLVTAADGGATESFVRYCLERTGGNPLLLGQLLVEENGPPSGRSAVGSLLDRLPDYVRLVGLAVAVLGGRELFLVARLAEVPVHTAETAVGMLRAQQILAPEGLEFRNESVRAGLLDGAGPTELARLRRAAATLLSDAAEPAEVVAEQVLQLAEPEPWMVDLLCDAATVASERGAPDTALRYLRSAAAARPEDVDLLVQLAEAVARVEPGNGFELLQHALERESDPVKRADIAVRLGRLALVVRRCGTAVRVLEDELTRLDEDLRPPVQRHLHALLGLVGIEHRDSVERLDSWLRADHVRPRAGLAEAGHFAVRAVVAALEGVEPEQAADWASRAIRRCDATVDDSPVSAAVLALMLADEVDLAHGKLTEVIDLVPAKRGEYLAFRGLVSHWCGNLTGAGADTERAYALASQEAGRSAAVVPRIALATVLVEQGEAGEADRVLRETDSMQLLEHTVLRPWFELIDARVRWALGEQDTALVLFNRCAESLAEVGITNPLLAPWWFEAVCLLTDAGQHEEAAELAAYGAAPALRWGTPRAIGMARLAEGITAEPGERVGLLEQACGTLAESPARREAALAEFELGRALIDVGELGAARQRLRRATRASLRLGDRQLPRRARQAAAAAGIPRQESPLASLSPAERRSVELAGRGVSNRVIAERLFVTVRTVETHLTSAYRKLQVTSRVELATALGQPPDCVEWTGTSR
ncbi:helix-turn-helix transcriptional regulator [Sciscionella sediminilitoris]|uniref:helix-turn-helix transcriptional regulator n=1 Tax=Sciscionella sediminilitoris TaxID=1445613 RepID=UPI00055F0C4D|nr:LuxR family transcriptional regulator [Sciscionella sp. SE31]